MHWTWIKPLREATWCSTDKKNPAPICLTLPRTCDSFMMPWLLNSFTFLMLLTWHQAPFMQKAAVIRQQTEIGIIIDPVCSNSQELELRISVFGYLLPTSAFKRSKDVTPWPGVMREIFPWSVQNWVKERTLVGQIRWPLGYWAIYDTSTNYAITCAHRGIKLQAYLNHTNTSCQHRFLCQSIRCQLPGMKLTGLLWEGQGTDIYEGTLPIQKKKKFNDLFLSKLNL